MEIVFTVLILLLAVALSGIAIRLLPWRPPLPLVQIAIGSLLAWPRLGLHVSFDPEIFMLLFIPPLLFADGWRIPKRELYLQRRAILMLAFGLVFITVVGVGYFAHWLIPGLPLPVAFALAAVLSPTDAVALSGIAGKGRIPAQLTHILEGEALMNDASGLVALKFAIAAALTGVFSLREASLNFVIVASGGLAVGALLAWLFSTLSTRFLNAAQEGDPAPGIVMTLLIPFASYLIAEHFELSGILSAVAAGMMMNYTSFSRSSTVAARVRAESTWSMIEFVFNGMVFIMLGLQMPQIIGRALLSAHHESDALVAAMIGYVLAMMAALYLIRFAWVWLLRWFASKRAARRGMTGSWAGFRTVALMTVGGVRGAITLAGVLSLPVALGDGTPLAGRDTAIFIASGVILGSLLVAVFGLPLLLRGLRTTPNPHAHEERAARAAAAQAAIRAIDATHDTLTETLDEADAARCADLTARVMDLYRRRLVSLDDADDAATLRAEAKQAEKMELQMKIAAVRAERAALYRMRAEQKINDETLGKLMREVDLSETALSTRKKGLV
ncbi:MULTISPECIES: Na+/H+ antiporter [Burkholderia]|jgi:Na+/H+ antiporter|uniref:Na+/H+ antiporter n=4 Tax=Burkholderia TaxID=32008 RepID=A0AAP1Y2S1_BURGA|nr:MULTISPECIES: Na+/H+ antiporter [Burkholderia]AEA62241.1 Na+/H+ antiporter [Burkholderia gladioli BSR3]AJW98920.1 Na+/H+ antiporter [Burkholderia gladioli]ASD81002.1 Na+/H+ antiporter [Burkholderia gladioli pv. gladioli]AWY53764.1 Na+/H+ antiporter [Burkholderia gladioli pv. gladioli]KAF1063338.1 Sodium, potassium, lithium and rubidium/H(+) antiporter [Burkholderia gladioli]